MGPIDQRIEASRELVFDVIAAPYLASPPSLADKIQVLERSEEMVLAAHRTPVRDGLVATTIEIVRFEPPDAIHFRLLRGPVPHVLERFELIEEADATLLHYEGELGTDLWGCGSMVGRVGCPALGRGGARIRRRDHSDRRVARRPTPAEQAQGNW